MKSPNQSAEEFLRGLPWGMFLGACAMLVNCGGSDATDKAVVPQAKSSRLTQEHAPAEAEAGGPAAARMKSSARGRSFVRTEIFGGLSLLLPEGSEFVALEPRGPFRGVGHQKLGIQSWFRESRVARTTKLPECQKGLWQSFSLLRGAGEAVVEERLDRPAGFVGVRSLRIGPQGEFLATLTSLESRRCVAVVVVVRAGAGSEELASEIFERSLPSVTLESIEQKLRDADDGPSL